MGLKVASSNLVSGKSSEFDGKKSSSLLSSIKTETNSKQNNQAMMNLTQKIKDGTSQKKDLTVVDFYKEVLERQPFDAETLAKKKVSVVLEGKKPAAQMSLSDYEMAKDRAIFKQAGYSMLTDKEIQMAVAAIKSHGAVNHGSDGLDKLRRIDNQPGVMFTKTDQATIEYAKRAGQAVLQYQQYQAKQTDAIQERNNNYATEALGGFVQPIVNAPGERLKRHQRAVQSG